MGLAKAVRFGHEATPQTLELLSLFREMVNDAIRICLNEGIRGRIKLRNRIYKEFQNRYGVVSRFPYSVAEVSWSIVKKHRRWQRKPYAKRLMLKMDADSFTINDSVLSLPFRMGQRLFIPLRYGDYQRSFLEDKTLKRGSITITDSSLLIAFTKPEARTIPPSRKIGYDLNEKSIVGSDGTMYDLSEVARLHTLYGVRRSKFYGKHPNDRRLKKKYSSSSAEKERVSQALHRVSKRIVEKASAKGEAIVLEALKGVRYANQKRNRASKGRRRRIAVWAFRQLQSYIDYKAKWAGVSVEYVSPSYTSKTCNACGYINTKLRIRERSWLCPSCGAKLNRDLNAAINIERRGTIRCLPVAQAGARGIDEAMKGNEKKQALILRAEALKSDSPDRAII